VRTRREGDCAVLVVADEGVGLSRSLAARVFDPFVQGERTLDRAEGGLGIGLTLVRHLAELHGGSARAHSDGEDRGSEFVITLPAIERPAHLAAKPRAGALGARRILLVEDNEDARETLRAVLEIEGHRVRVVGEGVEGLEMALADPPDVALVDLGLPGIDGYELARRFRAARPDAATLLIALTGYGTADDQARAIAAGFDAHFAKPLDFERFTALLRDTALEASPSSM
jgi:CheY-like chemotaxis protein